MRSRWIRLAKSPPNPRDFRRIASTLREHQMSQATGYRIRKFQVTVETMREAMSFLDRFYRKFGYLGGWNYSCTETAIKGPAMGPWVASIYLSPWHETIDLRHAVDLDKLLSKSNATEISG
jgi:hypothetical protein